MAAPGGSLSESNWNATYLLACQAVRRGSEDFSVASDDSDDLIWFSKFNFDEQIMGAGSRYSPRIKNDGTREKLISYAVFNQHFHDYEIFTVIAKLSPKFSKELLANRGLKGEDGEIGGYNRLVNGVITDILPSGASIKSTDKEDMYAHVLYFEPMNELAESIHELRIASELASEALNYPGVHHSYRMPCTFLDFLLLPGIGYGNYDRTCVAIRWRPLPNSSNDNILIPLTLTWVLNHYAICQIKSDLVKRIWTLPMGEEAYWSMFSTLRNFASYKNNYIEQRSVVENLIQRISEIEDAIDSEIDASYVYKELYGEFSEDRPWLRTEDAWAAKTMKQIFESSRGQADRCLTSAREKIVERVRILDGFLRDASMADVASANLELAHANVKLARKVSLLSWIVLIVSLLSLAVGVTPDVVKEKYFFQILGTHAND